MIKVKRQKLDEEGNFETTKDELGDKFSYEPLYLQLTEGSTPTDLTTNSKNKQE